MVSRPQNLLALLRGLSAGRLTVAVLCVLWLSPPPHSAEWPMLTWGVAAPATLVVFYLAAGLVARLRLAAEGSAGTVALLVVVLAAWWVVRLLPPFLWVHVVAALSAVAFATAARWQPRTR